MKLVCRFGALLTLVAVAALVPLLPGIHSSSSATALAQENAYVAIDMDAENGSGPCHPVDAARQISVGGNYKVAICLVNAPSAPAAFQISFNYDDTMNQCVPANCSSQECLDSNPDANVGASAWGTTLGDGWTCNMLGVDPPTCDSEPATGPGNGLIAITCLSVSENLTLPVGPDVASPLAVVTFASLAEGTDTFAMSNLVEVDDFLASAFVSCSQGMGPCRAGAISTEALPPTPTPFVPTPEPTSTPVPGPIATATAAFVATAIAQGTPASALTPGGSKTPATTKTAKPSATASADDGEDEDGGGMNVGLIAAIIAGGVVVVGGGGWLAYRRLRG